MKLSTVTALALFAATPAYASNFLVDFEKTWDFGNGSIDGYYGGGMAADLTTGPNLGVTFSGVSGLSNDDLGPYYANAPTLQGVMYVYDGAAVMNVAAGVDKMLSFYFSSPLATTNAVQAWSGLNGTGSLLGSLNLTANSSQAYDTWTREILSFSGTAHSFSLGGSLSGETISGDKFGVAFDNIAAVPEPETYAMLLAGLGLLGFMTRRRNQQAA